MPSEMSEHICEENIEENYESFDVIENDIMKARPQPISTINHRFAEQSFPPREERSIMERFNHENKVALNCDVDLIKTSKGSFVKPEITEDDKISGKLNHWFLLNLLTIFIFPTVVRAAGTWVPHNNSNSEQKLMSSPAELLLQSMAGPSSRHDDSSCDRPFCKLKRKKHEHCDLCNQGFTDNMKLKIHYLKHQHTKLGGAFDDSAEKSEQSSSQSKTHDDSEPHDLSKTSLQASPAIPNMMFPLPNAANPAGMMDGLSLQNLQLAHFYQQNSLYYQNLYPFLANQVIPGLNIEPQHPLMQFPFPAAAALANGNFDFGQNLTPSLLGQKRKMEEEFHAPKKQKTERPKEYQKKTYKDDSVPKGYLKFRFNEDCNFPTCGYRNHQSHFHCCRKDCFYSFCDKTRFVQHTARHERLDKLMGDDFKQFRANMHCGHQNCAYNKNLGPHNKSSHFHCLKCNYICSDTNKVVAHRRQHSKQEYIKLAGFRKYSNNEHCNIPDPHTPDGECPYTLKQSHYHCLVCQMGVLSRNQLSYHNHRIRPGMPPSEEIPMELANENGLVILNDNGSDENSTWTVCAI